MNAENTETGNILEIYERVYQLHNFHKFDYDYRIDGNQTPKRWRNGINEPVRNTPKIGRNEPCACGSGKKYKNCCL